jgi:hypothetical protein
MSPRICEFAVSDFKTQSLFAHLWLFNNLTGKKPLSKFYVPVAYITHRFRINLLMYDLEFFRRFTCNFEQLNFADGLEL